MIDLVKDCDLGYRGYDGTVTYHLRYTHFNPLKRTEKQYVNGNVSVGETITDEHKVRTSYLVQLTCAVHC